MEILPAIDLRSGKCVRLIQGDYQQQIDYNDDPVEVARSFEQAGTNWIHIVDLDGAKAGKIENLPSIKAIAKATRVKIEVGGGVRSLEDVQALLDVGVSRVILGTKALEAWGWFEDLAHRADMAGKLALGLDARDGVLAIRGWTEQSQQRAVEVAKRVRGWALGAIIYTDISKDGMLAGANLEATEELAGATDVGVIAAGGVTSEADVEALAKLPLAGMIIGRALYEGRIDLSQAIQIVQSKADAGENGIQR